MDGAKSPSAIQIGDSNSRPQHPAPCVGIDDRSATPVPTLLRGYKGNPFLSTAYPDDE